MGISRGAALWAIGSALTLLPPAPGQLASQGPERGALPAGDYAPGFRLVETHDRGRTLIPSTDFAGHRAEGVSGVPMQLGIWYPTARKTSAAPMTYLEMALATAHRERFGPLTAEDSAATIREVGQMARNAGGDTTAPESRPAATLARRTASVRNAPLAPGTFPVVVIATGGWLGATTVLAEYLVSHGWIVVATAGQTATSSAAQVTEPVLAIDAGLNAIEFALAFASTLPGADPTRLALIGFNFDSFSVLEFQARYMRALVVVTINGWETIDDRAEVLRTSPWYAPARLRVPLLNVHWDEAGSGSQNTTFLEGLQYAERRSLVISGLNHFGLIGNPLAYPFSSASQRTGYQYLMRAVHSTLSSGIGAGQDGFFAQSPVESGYPADVVKDQWYRAALPPVPTRQEFFEIIGNRRDLAAATRLFRQARERDSTVQLFTEGDMNLAAFRFQQASRLEDAVAVHRLTLEAYPTSHLAHNGLGNVLLASGDTAAAVGEFEVALVLLEANGRLSAAAKEEQARVWRAKIGRLRRGGT